MACRGGNVAKLQRQVQSGKCHEVKALLKVVKVIKEKPTL